MECYRPHDRFMFSNIARVLAVIGLLLASSGCESNEASEPHVRDLPPASPRTPPTPPITPAFEFLPDGVYVIEAPQCEVVRNLEEAVEALKQEQPELPLHMLDWDEIPPKARLELEIGGGSPWIIAVKDGHQVDARFGAYSNRNRDGLENNEQKLRAMLLQNDLLAENSEPVLRKVSLREKGDDIWAYPSLNGIGMDGLDLRGVDLRGESLRGAVLSGSDLGGADLRDANLEGAFLFHTSLRGAQTAGAHWDGARWGATICPNGTKSDERCADL